MTIDPTDRTIAELRAIVEAPATNGDFEIFACLSRTYSRRSPPRSSPASLSTSCPLRPRSAPALNPLHGAGAWSACSRIAHGKL